MNFIKNTTLFCFILLVTGSSCKKFITADVPRTSLVGASVFENDSTAKAAMTGIYNAMMLNLGTTSGLSQNLSSYPGLSADELLSYATGAATNEFAQNSLTPGNNTVSILWRDLYRYIYISNSVIEGLSVNTGVSPAVKARVTGEAKFVRAFCYFYLVNLFGDVPLLLTTDYRVNAVSVRHATQQVYQQIIDDLNEARNALDGDYSFSSTQRIRPNKWAATALLSRVHLYIGNWLAAEELAGSVIAYTPLFSLKNNLNDVFLKNSTEAIWQLMSSVLNYNTWEGSYYILITVPNMFALSPSLNNIFNDNDLRKSNWIGRFNSGSQTYLFPHKYKIRGGVAGTSLNEYAMILRLAEQYLIRGEARARQNNLTGGVSDLNIIRNRAGLTDTTITTQEGLLKEIAKERQRELFTEMGHRWFDLKRTSRTNDVLGPFKGTSWDSHDVLYPIPQSDIINNPNLTQNTGYE